jgi:hypothetical protein
LAHKYVSGSKRCIAKVTMGKQGTLKYFQGLADTMGLTMNVV